MDPNAPRQTECTVHGILAFVLRLSRLLGIAPLSFKSLHGGLRVRVSWFFGLYGLLLIIVFILLCMVALVADLTIDTEKSFKMNSNANRFVWISDIILVFVVVIAAALTGINRMRHVIDCLAKLQKINKELDKYNQEPLPSNRKNSAIVVFALLLGCVIVFTDHGKFMYKVVTLKGKIITSSFYIFRDLTCIKLELIVIQFSLIVMWVLSTLQRLNNCLMQLLEETFKTWSIGKSDNTFIPLNSVLTGSKTNYPMLPKRIHRVRALKIANRGSKMGQAPLTRLAFLYVSVCDIVRQLDKSHGVLLVLLLMSFLLHMIITPYHLITGLIRTDDHSDIPLEFAWGIYHLLMLALVIEPCHRTITEMENTQGIINDMLHYTSASNTVLISKLKAFNRHIIMNDVSISPMQLFTLDRALVATMVGSITTYLVVIIEL